jgi:hypothetical protein
MKKFVLKVLLFALVIGGLTISLILLTDSIIKNKKKELLKLAEGIHLVFAGNSAVECAVDDKIVTNSINIAQSGEAYLYSFVKLRALLEANGHIEAVFIGYSFADILFEKEESWLFSDEFVTEKIQYYNYLMEWPEKRMILMHNPKAYFNGLTKSIFNSLKTYFTSTVEPKTQGQLVNFGGYKYLIRDKLLSDPGFDLLQNKQVRKSVQQEKYLQKISELCHLHGVELILFNTPKHKSYIDNLDSTLVQMWLDTRNSLPKDSLLDLSSYQLPDSCFGDLSHLNYNGAGVFSVYLNDLFNGLKQ